MQRKKKTKLGEFCYIYWKTFLVMSCRSYACYTIVLTGYNAQILILFQCLLSNEFVVKFFVIMFANVDLRAKPAMEINKNANTFAFQ